MKRSLFRPVALLGTVAVILTLTTFLTLSGATFTSGLGSLKCYDITGGKQKAC